MGGCVRAIDELLTKTKMPASNEAASAKALCSDHHKRHGVNVQATCDADRRFTALSAAAPGGANDCAAVKATTLPQKISSLPWARLMVGGDTHACTEHLLTPFEGIEESDHSKGCFNHHLSQHRTRVECSFDRMVSKWCILKRPLEASLDSAARAACCVAGLHSCCIDSGDTVLLTSNREAVKTLPVEFWQTETERGRP